MNVNTTQAVSQIETWESYLSQKDEAYLESGISKGSLIGNFIKSLKLTPGKVFELGCGGSIELLKLAKSGWQIGGIDYHQESINKLEEFARKSDFDADFYCGDILNFNLSRIEKKSLLVSFGLLEHFQDPAFIISKWSKVLETNGLVVSVIPNLTSVNAKFLQKLDPELWHQHICYDAQELDAFHLKAGLEVVQSASYIGNFDEFYLIPWMKIKGLFSLPVFKTFKYSSSFLISPVLKVVSKYFFRKALRPYIIGVYRKV